MGGHRGSTVASPGIPAQGHDSQRSLPREEPRGTNPATPTPRASPVGPSEEVPHSLSGKMGRTFQGGGTARAKAIQENVGFKTPVEEGGELTPNPGRGRPEEMRSVPPRSPLGYQRSRVSSPTTGP